jgi:DNA-binding NarL/FixJ family response regulator
MGTPAGDGWRGACVTQHRNGIDDYIHLTRGLRMIAGKTNVWLVGPTVSEDWDLIQALKLDYVVTLIHTCEPALLAKEAVLKSATLIVVDCGARTGDAARIFEAIRSMKKKLPGLVVLLADGGLAQEEIAQAYRLGVRDFFPSPYDARLLAERIVALCRRGSA